MNAHRSPLIRALSQNSDQEAINRGCRAGQRVMKTLIKKAEEIPNLSQEEFDADWGKMWCGA
jgi:hypothetical protein